MRYAELLRQVTLGEDGIMAVTKQGERVPVYSHAVNVSTAEPYFVKKLWKFCTKD